MINRKNKIATFVQEQIMVVLYKDFKKWQSSHKDMGLELYEGIEAGEALKRLPWWVRGLSILSKEK